MYLLSYLFAFTSLWWTVCWAQQSLPPWETETFWFSLDPVNDTITRCNNVNLAILPRPGYTSAGPYTVMLYRAGQAPYRFSMGSGPSYPWTVNLKPGGPYLLSMDDANGFSGGVSKTFNVVTGSTTCPDSAEVPQSLAVNILNASAGSCDIVSFEVTGGTAPYTLTLTAAAMNTKTVVFATGRFDYVLDLPAGTDAVFSVEDSAGRGSVGQVFKVAQGSSTSCVTAAPTILQARPTTTYPGALSTTQVVSGSVTLNSVIGGTPSSTSSPTSSSAAAKGPSGPPVAVVVGAVIGGLALILLLVLLILYLRTRRKQQHSEPRDEKKHGKLANEAAPVNSNTTSPLPSPTTNARTTVTSQSYQTEHPSAYNSMYEPPESARDNIHYRVPSDLIHPSQQYHPPHHPTQQYHPPNNAPMRTYPNQNPTLPQAMGPNTYMPGQPSGARSYSPPPAASKEERHFSYLSGVTRSSEATTDGPSAPPQYQWNGRR